MKIALLLSGQIRSAKKCYNSLYKYIIDPYSPDIYIDTWDDRNKIKSSFNGFIENDMDIDEVIKTFSPVKISIEDLDSENAKYIINISKNYVSPYSETSVENLFFQYYKIKNVFNLIPNPKQYDIIFRTRFDIEFNHFIDFNDFHYDYIQIPNGWDHRDGINDLVAFGDFKNMSTYCSLYDNIIDYISEGCILHPELILKYHLLKQNILINRPIIECFLRGIPIHQQ